MNGGENKDAEARELQRQLHRFVGSQLADENHVGIFATRASNRMGIRRCMHADFAVRDARLLRDVNELDRVFDGEHVARTRCIDVIDHGRKRGRLSRTSGTRHQN